MLFTDGSVNAKLKIGFGAYLLVANTEFEIENIKTQVKTKQFNETSSTKLELQTLLWALREIPDLDCKLIIYSDSQNAINLLSRKERFEKNNFSSKKNQFICNHIFYKEFFSITENLNCKFIKVKGHKKFNQKDKVDRLFSIVDKASRSALKKYIQNSLNTSLT